MFGLGFTEILVIFVVALLVLGPEKLPQLARQLAKTLGELRRTADEIRRNFDEASIEPEVHQAWQKTLGEASRLTSELSSPALKSLPSEASDPSSQTHLAEQGGAATGGSGEENLGGEKPAARDQPPEDVAITVDATTTHRPIHSGVSTTSSLLPVEHGQGTSSDDNK